MRTVFVFMTLVLIGVAVAGPIDTDFIEWTQPDGTRFVARLWGDEFEWWMETSEGYRIIQGSDDWYYYAALDATGEYTASSSRVGIDPPDPISYKLERSVFRQAEIQQMREVHHVRVEESGEWFAQKQAQVRAMGQPVNVHVGVILVEFRDVKHYRDTRPVPTRPFGYLKADFDSMLFSEDYWIGPLGNIRHPEGNQILGSMRDYYWQMSHLVSTLVVT